MYIFQKSIQICVCFWHSRTLLVLLASCVPMLFSTHTSLCCHASHRTTHWVFRFYLHTQAIPSRGVGVETFAHKDFFIACFTQMTLYFPHFFLSCFSQLYSTEILWLIWYNSNRFFFFKAIELSHFMVICNWFSVSLFDGIPIPYLMGFTFFLDFFPPTWTVLEQTPLCIVSSYITAFLFMG